MKILQDFIHHQTWVLVFLSTLMWRTVGSEVYKSIHWSPLNPKFQFSDDLFKNGLAYYSQIVSSDSQIIIICPNIATILTNLTRYPLRESLYENLWMVREEEFHSCRINSSKSSSHLVHTCNRPDSLHYYTVHLVHQNTSLSYSDPANATSIYFLATSNGTKESLNHTSGGHCMDPTNGISMRIQFKVCEVNSTDPSCKFQSQSVVNNTQDIKTCKNTTVKGKPLGREFTQERFWEILAIILGVLLVVSFIIHSTLIICYCVRKNRRTTNQLSQGSQKGSDEPLKSLIVDPYKKKAKHGRKSAAL